MSSMPSTPSSRVQPKLPLRVLLISFAHCLTGMSQLFSAALWHRSHHRPPPLAPTRPRGGHDRGTHPRAFFQAGSALRIRDRNQHPRRRTQASRRRDRRKPALRSHGLAGRASGGHRAPPCQEASQGGSIGTHDLGMELQPMLSAGPPRLFPRRQERSAADRVRAAVRSRRMAGRDRGFQGQYCRPVHGGCADRQVAPAFQVGRPGR